jgi:GT2 family glycosyltransferase
MTVVAHRPLCIVGAYLATDADADAMLRCLVSLWSTQADVDVLVVDDGSPAGELLTPLAAAAGELGFELLAGHGVEGHAATVNLGLRRALKEGRDAVLLAPDVEFTSATWLDALQARTDGAGRPAAVVGARLLYPSGDIQHAGRIFSQLTRKWAHRFQHGPGDLPEALVPCRCPVGGGLMLIRHATLATVGLFDEAFGLGGQDLDYCLRVFGAGLECIYEPTAVAVRHDRLGGEHLTERRHALGRRSRARLLEKWGAEDLSPFVMEAL